MIIKVLGTVSPYPKHNSNCPGFLVTTKKNKIMLDCGNGSLKLMNLPNDLNDLIVIISHLHSDHYGDLLSLAYASYCYHNLGFINHKIKVYLPRPNSNEEKMICKFLTSCKENYINYQFYDYDTKLYVNDTIISFNKNKHNITTYSTKIKENEEVIVYTSDTGYNNEIIRFSEGADVLICESTFLKHQHNNANHLCAYQSGLIAKKANVDTLFLTHFWPEIDKQIYVDEAKEAFDNVIGAEENKVLKLGGKNEKSYKYR